MSTLAKTAYLTALLRQNDQRIQRYTSNLAECVAPHDKLAAQNRLSEAQAHDQDLTAERAALGY